MTINDLPPELLTPVFQLLGRDRREHISAYRLVSRTWNALSSPYLLTEIILSYRPRDVAKAKQLITHPHLGGYVTTAIYDASNVTTRHKEDMGDMAKDLPSLLCLAFRELPALRKLVFTDVRGVANNGETYDQLRTRVFGFDFYPDTLGEEIPKQAWSKLCDMLTQLADAGATLEHLSIGDNMFASDDPRDEGQLRSRPGVDIPSLFSVPRRCLDALSCTLRTLYLPLHFKKRLGGSVSRLQLHERDAAACPLLGLFENLEELTLDAGDSTNPMHLQDVNADRNAAEQYFLQVLTTMTPRRLETLQLRSWPLQIVDLAEIVQNNAKTLRYLHISNCVLAHDPYGPSEISTDSTPFACLEGVEITRLHVLAPERPSSSEDQAGRWLPTSLHDAEERLCQFGQPDLRPVEVLTTGRVYFGAQQDRVHEAAILGGRRNRIVRKKALGFEEWSAPGGWIDPEGSRVVDDLWAGRPHYWWEICSRHGL
ncbi:hypothetical protein B0A48_17838 [Cryoendolithus antarcticus]|uniref:F-box domain-containing protein n=1 Tax=Cryoendolithus antarcticus TaxID=1507870 RepID=A0A1V8SAV0_9PEZI|nr:hypothetical protein B0A48_17838 [Cryoendolithus antarcticus]